MEEPVTIVDRDVLKVLSADTRMDILKMLAEGGRMPSFIGRKLDKSDATIVEHLQAMEKAGLVKKVEQPGRKFVFYTLTERGLSIVSSKSRRLVILLSSSILSLCASVFLGYIYLVSQQAGYSYFLNQEIAKTAVPAEAISGGVSSGLPSSFPAVAVSTEAYLLLAVSLALLAFSMAGFALYAKGKAKFKGGLK